MKFSDLSLSSKQVAAAVLILLIMAAVNVFSILEMAELKDSIISIAELSDMPQVKDADLTYRKTTKIIVLLLGFTAAVALGIAAAIAGYITEPLGRLVDAARSVAAGDLNVELPVESKDEIGSLTDSFNTMTAALREAEEQNKRQAVQLAMQDKMASLGNLVAGVAHEVNSPIGAINSAAQTSGRALELISEALEDVSDLQELKNHKRFKKALKVLRQNTDLTATGGERIANIVKSLKEFSKLDEAEYQAADIHDGLGSALELLDHQLQSRIEVVKEFSQIPQILCYPNRLNQAFMNVLRNAVDAIEGSGKITITTVIEEAQVRVSIADSGAGISTQDLPNIYEPGFTTKGVGVGLGLGLSTVHNIVEQHGGQCEVDSKTNVGTRFSILLPLRTKEPEEAQ